MVAAVTTYDLKSLPPAQTGVSASTVLFGSTAGQPKPVPDPILMTALTEYLDTLYSGALNVKFYGAVGDATTDDTAAIQAAIDAASANGASIRTTIVFPPGNYKITGTLLITNLYSIELRGFGSARENNTYQTSRIFWDTPTGPLISITGPTSGFTIANLGVAYTGSYSGNLLSIDGTGSGIANGLIDNCFFGTQSGGSGGATCIHLDYAYQIAITNSLFCGGAVGIKGSATGITSGVTISNNWFNTQLTTVGIQGGGTAWSVLNNVFEPASGTIASAFDTTAFGVKALVYQGNWHGDTESGTWLKATGGPILGGEISGNTFGAPGGTAINLGSSVGIAITGNEFNIPTCIVAGSATDVSIFSNAYDVNVVTRLSGVPAGDRIAFTRDVDVRDYGAVGDGTTNDTAAFNAAIATGLSIYVPDGTYLLNALDVITHSGRLYGAGRTSILKFNTTGVGVDIALGSPYTQTKGFVISDLRFTNVTNTPSRFIRNTDSTNFLVERCYFTEAAATYCIEDAANASTGYGFTARDCVISSHTGSGIKIGDGNGACSIIGCDLSNLSVDGVVAHPSGGYLLVSDTIIEGCSGKGITIETVAVSDQGWNINIDGSYFETNTGTDIDLPSNGSFWCTAVITATVFIGAPTINLGAKSAVTLVGVTCGGGNELIISGSAGASAALFSCQNVTQSGTFTWTNIADQGTGLTTLGETVQFGGSTSSFPALHRSGGGLQVLLAGTSTLTYIQPSHLVIGDAARGVIKAPADGVISLTNIAETDFSRLQFGGTSASFPALKRSSTALETRLADDSGYADFRARSINLNGLGLIFPQSDGVFTLLNNAATSFTRLQFGGSSSSFPSLARSGDGLNVKLADDSAWTSLRAAGIYGDALILDGANQDVHLERDAANTLAQRNGTSAQDFRIYNTYSGGGSNYERLEVGIGPFGANTFSLAVTQGGTGTPRALLVGTTGANILSLVTNNTSRWNVDASGHLLAGADNTYDIGASGATRPRNLYLASNLFVGAIGGLKFDNSRSAIFSPADGNILLNNAAGSSFGLLQFGGVSASFPSLKRTSAGIDLRLADDSAYTSLRASHLFPGGNANNCIGGDGVQIWFGDLSAGPAYGFSVQSYSVVACAGSASLGWTNSAFNAQGAVDTAFMRTSAGVIELNNGTLGGACALRLNQTPAAVGTGVKTINAVADSSTNFGHYISINMNGTTYYIPASSVAPT